MTGATRVYLARHGRTAFNADGRLRGLSNPPLDEVGVAEVARLAAELATLKPALVLSSPLQRAVATAQAIASAAGVESMAVLAERARRAFFELTAEVGPGPVA